MWCVEGVERATRKEKSESGTEFAIQLVTVSNVSLELQKGRY